MMASKTGDVDNQSKAVSQCSTDKVVAIPFPVCPRRVGYGPLAKVIDFLPWKNCHKEADDTINETLDEIAKLPIAEQKIWLIRKILEVYDFGDGKDFYKLYEILCEESSDGA